MKNVKKFIYSHFMRILLICIVFLCTLTFKNNFAIHTMAAEQNSSSCIISFNSNGGTNVSSVKTLESNQTYGILPKTTRKGYKFLGWYTGKTKGNKIVSSTKFTGKDNTILYAHWKPITYKIIYKTQNGKLSGTYRRTFQIVTKTFRLPIPRRSGYTFRGWSNSASKFKKVTQIKKDTIKNRTFYAWWRKNTEKPSKITSYKAPEEGKKYIVGVDIPAGEYFMKPVVSLASGIVDYKGNEIVGIYYDEHESGNKIITLEKGYSISYDGYIAIPINQSGKLADIKKSGYFKVGLHIPAGKHKLKATSFDGYGMYFIFNSSLPRAASKMYSFKGSTTINLKKGQYICTVSSKFIQ